jgi:hypothetical protein
MLSARWLPALIVTLLALIGAASADVPADRCPEAVTSPDFLLTTDLQRTADNWQVQVALGWRAETDCWTLQLDGSGVSLSRITPEGARVLASSSQAAVTGKRPATELRVRRRGAELIVSASDELLLRALIEEPLDGRLGAWAVEGATVGEMLVQPLGEIAFDEDFFEREQVPGRWETLRGDWQVGVYYDPLQRLADFAPGACWYESGEGECLAATGHWFWDSYRAEATVRLIGGAGGLACHIEGDDAFAFVLSADDNKARIMRRDGDSWRTLAAMTIPVESAQWYRLGLQAYPGRLVGSVNSRELVTADVPEALVGHVGLLALDSPGSRFDDVRVRGMRGVAMTNNAPLAWDSRGGDWQGEGDLLRGRTAGAEVATLRAGSWTDCAISAQVKTSRGVTAGLVAHHQSGDRAYLFTITSGKRPVWRLHVVSGGQTEKLAEGPATAAAGLMTMTWVGGKITCDLNGERLCRAWDFRAAPGRAGVYVSGGAATFAGFTVVEPERAPQRAICDAEGTGAKVPALQEKVFVRKIGGLWRAKSGRWRAGQTASGPTITCDATGGRGLLRFHQVTPGDPRVVAEVIAPRETEQFGLGICAGDESGYAFKVWPGDGIASLTRRGEEVARLSDLTLGGGDATVELLRDGVWVVARLGESQGLAWRDDDPLPAGHAEVYTSASLRMSRLILTSDNALIYPFDRPEADWRPAAGVWGDHSGMACILWDYWMSGDGREEPALIWNARPVRADVTVDVQVSEYTEGYADGAHMHFPYHDAKVVLCGRPAEPDSGYAFIVGEGGGRRTVLLREGVEVASSDDSRFRIVMGGHCNSPRAVNIRASVSGGRVALTVSGVTALEWDDPEPLPGGYVGLGLRGCRANFRDCAIYPDRTWLGDS